MAETLKAVRPLSARFRQQRQLLLAGVAADIGQHGRIIARKTMVGELRALWIALVFAHRLVDAFHRQESERVAADILAHLLEVMGGGQKLVAFGWLQRLAERLAVAFVELPAADADDDVLELQARLRRGAVGP